MKSRINLICTILCLFYFGFLTRGFLLQFFPDERLISAKKRNFEKVIRLKPRRGIIYDRYGRELAITIASYSLFADPSLIKDPYACAHKLSRLLKTPWKSIYKKIKNKKRRFIWLKRHVTEKEWEQIRSWNILGLAFVEEPKRIYPNDSLLGQTLGFVGRDGQGLEGIELSYNTILRGEEKKVLVQKDAMGRALFTDTTTNLINLRTNGADIYLTIDSDLQFFFERELKKTVKKYDAHSALGVIMRPQTGEILAMVNYPVFNLNQPFHSSPELFRNRCVTDSVEPGSTLKPFIIAAALKKNIPPTRNYNNKGGKFVVEGHIINEAESIKVTKDLSLREILSTSSNVGIAQLALDIKSDFLYNTLKDFGFGSRLNLHFPGESAGILNKPPWKKLQLATIGFGHALSVTPLQLTTAYSAIANGGFLKRPYFVKAIHYKESGRKELFKPDVIRTVLTPEQAKILTVMLISAVSNEGTGRRARVKGFLSAGKTGTAQIVDSQKGGYLKGQYISSFAGFIPAQNPQFVIYIAINKPQKAFYGSIVAAPVFSHVAEYAVRKSGLSPVLINEENILKKSTKLYKNASNILFSDSKKETPDFTGLSLRSAYYKARKLNIHLNVKGSGQVIRTIPFAGDPLPKTRSVRLIMSD